MAVSVVMVHAQTWALPVYAVGQTAYAQLMPPDMLRVVPSMRRAQEQSAE